MFLMLVQIKSHSCLLVRKNYTAFHFLDIYKRAAIMVDRSDPKVDLQYMEGQTRC